ncbi:Homeobox-containing protein 1-like protein [Leptotrombidium deliense]|uniref:Homeobox-containing protein 1-like protein n=1 Tax=Leptotrombidium deliense TaxID=299467 RepID=A0A443S0P8_9ACAR|nr:Homeobox-containing protein 1-like protein [Leptotrombidium deliense]
MSLQLNVEQVYLLVQLMRSGMSNEEIVAMYDRIDREMTEEENSASNPELLFEQVHQQIASLNEEDPLIPLLSLTYPIDESNESKTECNEESKNEEVDNKSFPESLTNRKLPLINYEETAELQVFKSKGDDAILKEIRKFVSAFNISQVTVADMIRVSQGYVSRYMNGDFDQVSDRVKTLIYLWYLQCRNNPLILQQCLGSRAVISETGTLLPIKRDKFKFHKCHLSILERFYKQNKYPDTAVKKLIAETCNYTLKNQLERELNESETVTVTLVNTWLNNRRKTANK